ncbi:carbamoyltransferase HypF [Methanococcoides methylutens]|uniref:Carbamoyltransferase n=1 Tax=Methanococcoides methylutens MM1 TaxID=1434104 RepID=A0A0E3X1L6_METMT|nr:carbamoyltransferase HypF [Methanococcoides methylutens]AKB85384.1 [NiFe] hydrogenase metallocenter assembly protein HypF [Methanococcoides methylutens MM1]
MQTQCRKINVSGVVQGVGFRPFVHHIAIENGLCGYVKNTGNDVEIVSEGKKENIERFLHELQSKRPPLASVDQIRTKVSRVSGFSNFSILDSEQDESARSIIPPDTAICSDCLRDMYDSKDRHFHYPFTSCTNCGPRYSLVSSLPFDRGNTSMDQFPLCTECSLEYKFPSDRRFHAQATCCPECGPVLSFTNCSGDVLASGHDAILRCAELIDEGSIVAIKGYGGFHLVCDATSDSAVLNLRDSLNRSAQPFAVMAKDIDTVSSFACINAEESSLLQSRQLPIVVLDKNGDFSLSSHIAPDLHNMGVMLPYSGTHHLLFDNTDSAVYVMTSANLPGLPMLTDSEEALSDLSRIADHFLLHNYVIRNRIDDSVIRLINGKKAFIRRSRGFVPERIELPFSIESVIGVGPELNTTVTLAKDNNAYISQYIGNTSHFETAQYHKQVISDLERLTKINPYRWGCDLHPEFNTTRFAQEQGGNRTVFVQHHYAHIVSLMVDNLLPADSRIIGIALDGAGYGEDGTIWGGEVFEATYSGYERVAHLMEQSMPGGDMAAIYPSRMVLGMLHDVLEPEELRELPLYFRHGESERNVVLQQLERNVNLVRTSSFARVLDSAAALLGISHYRSYQGEPAMKLESVARDGVHDLDLPVVCKRGVLDTTSLLYGLYERLDSHDVRDLAYSIEDALAVGVAELAVSAAKKRSIDVIGLSGGVAYNEHITGRICEVVKDSGFEFLTHNRIPCGDGGVSLGQAVVAGYSERRS